MSSKGMTKEGAVVALGAFLCAGMLALPSRGAAVPLSWQVDPEASEVQFTSDWPLRVTGTTKKVRGSVRWDPADLSSLQAQFAVDLASIKTGISRRDRTMREKCLETDKYPEVRFELAKVLSQKGALSAGTSTQILVAGRFDLHGRPREEEIAVDVLPGPEPGQLRVRSKFPLLLSNYAIFRPRIMLMKFADRVFVRVDLLLNASKPGAP